MRVLPAVVCAWLLCTACSAPPHKEIDQAQGAVDAARAAGAEQYATDEFAAATAALQQAQDAVQQRDYRQALSRALDARERAQDAAKQAADGKARARSEAEKAASVTATALQQLRGKIAAAEAARVAARDLEGPRTAVADVEASLQKARAGIQAGTYLEASAALKGTKDAIAAQIAALDRAVNARPARVARPARRRR
jgi:hypothetical protein